MLRPEPIFRATLPESYGLSAGLYRDFNGFVSSANGSAYLGVYGTASGGVDAAVDALAATVGQFVGTVSAGEYAGILALDDVNGSLSAGLAGLHRQRRLRQILVVE